MGTWQKKKIEQEKKEFEEMCDEVKRLTYEDHGMSEDEIACTAEVILSIKNRLLKGISGKKINVSIDGGAYQYVPASAKLNKWVTSDGSDLNVSLASLLLEYVSVGWADNPDDIVVPFGLVSQDVWEGRKFGCERI